MFVLLFVFCCLGTLFPLFVSHTLAQFCNSTTSSQYFYKHAIDFGTSIKPGDITFSKTFLKPLKLKNSTLYNQCDTIFSGKLPCIGCTICYRDLGTLYGSYIPGSYNYFSDTDSNIIFLTREKHLLCIPDKVYGLSTVGVLYMRSISVLLYTCMVCIEYISYYLEVRVLRQCLH